MRYILLLIPLLAISACTITTKEPRDELVARNAALAGEVKSNESLREIIKWMQEQKSEARSQQFNEWIQSRSAGGLGDVRCDGGSRCGGPVSTQPIYQPQPSQPIIVIPPSPPSIQPMPPQQPQQPIFIQPMPSQPTIQPIPLPQPQPPVWIQPMPPVSTQPVPPQGGPNCYWRADGQGNYVWMCTGGPISYPTQPGNGYPVIQNPQDFNEKQ